MLDPPLGRGTSSPHDDSEQGFRDSRSQSAQSRQEILSFINCFQRSFAGVPALAGKAWESVVSDRGLQKFRNLKGSITVAVFVDGPSLAVVRAFPEPVPAVVDRLCPLRLIAQGDTGHTMKICFLLQTTRV